MCHHGRVWNIALLALGAGLILSCLFSGWLIRLLMGAVLIAVSLFLCQHI